MFWFFWKWFDRCKKKPVSGGQEAGFSGRRDEDQVIHQSSFYLVDQNGKVVKDYDGAKNTPYDEIIADIKTLENRW